MASGGSQPQFEIHEFLLDSQILKDRGRGWPNKFQEWSTDFHGLGDTRRKHTENAQKTVVRQELIAEKSSARLATREDVIVRCYWNFIKILLAGHTYQVSEKSWMQLVSQDERKIGWARGVQMAYTQFRSAFFFFFSTRSWILLWSFFLRLSQTA